MASRRRKVRRLAGTYLRNDENLSAEIKKLLQRAPQLEPLKKALADSEFRLTDSQQKFVDDFAVEVRKRARGVDDASYG